MEGKIVFSGQSKTGLNFLVRYPQMGDEQAMADYINTLSKERTFIRFQGEEITLEDELKYLNRQLEKIKEQQAVQLLILSEDKILGISAVDMKGRTESHEGVFGISIAKEYRGQGLGKTLMDLTLQESVKNLPQLRLITLGVFGDNPQAKHLYSSFGFLEYGRLPEGVLHQGQYVDHIFMYKKVV